MNLAVLEKKKGVTMWTYGFNIQRLDIYIYIALSIFPSFVYWEDLGVDTRNTAMSSYPDFQMSSSTKRKWLFREMADTGAGAEKAQDKPGTPYYAWVKGELKEYWRHVKRKQKPAQIKNYNSLNI